MKIMAKLRILSIVGAIRQKIIFAASTDILQK